MTADGNHQRWFFWGGILLIGVLSIGLVWHLVPKVPVPPTITWKPQPDEFPMGATIQGSRVEFSVALFTGQKATPVPAFFGRLPSRLQHHLGNAFMRVQAASVKARWRFRVEAPPFVRVGDSKVDFHPTHGVFVAIHAHLDTSQPGQWEGSLRASLRNRAGATNAIAVPIRVRVLPRPDLKVWRVLVTETPYDLYSTGRGSDFLPLAEVTGHLAERGIQVDFLDQLPASLAGYDLILLAGSTLASLPPPRIQELRERIARGAHVVLAADAFFHGTSQKATELMGSYGLEMENTDAGLAVTNVAIVDDQLTERAQHVGFWRPARITITDPAQSRILVRDQEGAGGFVAVSRGAGRGDLRIVAQSLWWNWVRLNPAQEDNAKLMENLLHP